MNIDNGLKLGKEIARVYGGIYKSQDIANSIADYCMDAHLVLPFDELKYAGFVIGRELGVMQPTSKMIRNAMEVINQYLKEEC